MCFLNGRFEIKDFVELGMKYEKHHPTVIAKK